MFVMGNYPLTVRILNLFDPQLEVTLNIVRCHRRSYFRKIEKGSEDSIGYFKDAPENIPEPRTYTIQGGDSLAFPMYYCEDSLEISLSGTPNRKYCIVAGAKAKCYPIEGLGAPNKGTSLGSGTDDAKKVFYRGGTWIIDLNDSDCPNNENWILRIKKYGPDPEDDDIVIGEDPPE
jgi:hypothetical protein